jgi:hypothetical protein
VHAALVTAYKDFEMLERLVVRLRALGMEVFVHIDTRSVGARQIVHRIRALDAEAHSWYPIHWGSRSHLAVLLRLMRIALQNPRITYVHTLSGQDYPIKSLETFNRVCDGRVFMDCHPIESLRETIRRRFEFYHIRDLLGPRLRLPDVVDRMAVSTQKLFGIRRLRTHSHASIMKGLVWLSMPSDAARYCCESLAAQELWAELKYAALPEEFYFQTLLSASPFAHWIDVDNKRFMDWRRRGDARPPRELDLSDFQATKESSALFARKFDSKLSGEILDKVDLELL